MTEFLTVVAVILCVSVAGAELGNWVNEVDEITGKAIRENVVSPAAKSALAAAERDGIVTFDEAAVIIKLR